jgi:hypothetical protein
LASETFLGKACRARPIARPWRRQAVLSRLDAGSQGDGGSRDQPRSALPRHRAAVRGLAAQCCRSAGGTLRCAARSRAARSRAAGRRSDGLRDARSGSAPGGAARRRCSTGHAAGAVPPPPIAPPVAPLVDSAGALPAAAPGAEAASAAAAAPIIDAAALAAPPVPVVPLGGLGGVPAPVGVVPPIPVGSAMPDIGLPLPSTLPIPTDLVCEGTAWSAHRDSDSHVGAASSVGRRDRW